MKFRTTFLAVPMFVMAVAAFAQTDSGNTETKGGDGPNDFGQNWPHEMGTTFFTDDTMQTLRGDEELRTAWKSMSEVDRQMVHDDCGRLKGRDAPDSTAATVPSTPDSSGSADDASTQADTSATTTGKDAGSDSETEGSAMTHISVTSENMSRMCTLFELN